MVLCLFALALLLALAVLLFSYVLVLHTNDADDGIFSQLIRGYWSFLL